MKEKSYTELSKSYAMKSKRLKESYVLDLYIEMLLSEITLNVEKEKLIAKIDKAIDDRNRQEFFHLSKQYQDLNKRYGT